MIHIVLKQNIKKILIEDTIHGSDIGVLKKELSSALKHISYVVA